MIKLTREQVSILVNKIRTGEGDDVEVGQWVQQIGMSVPHPEVIKTIMGGSALSDEEVVAKLYAYQSTYL